MDISRKTAFLTLLDIEKKGAYSNLALNDNLSGSEAADPAFVRELTYGVLKNEYLLDFILKGFVKKGFGRLKTEDLMLLRLGAYQIYFMDSVPDYAAVSETVNLAKKYARGREGFINGVLRSLTRTDHEIPEIPKDDFVNYLSIRYSVKEWIADLLIKAFGPEEAEKYLRSSNETPDLSIRANLMKNTREDLMNELESLGFSVKGSDISERSLKVKGSGVLSTAAFKEGRFSVQDEASTLAADMVSPGPGMRVLDMCAAPGGKTIAMAELMENSGEVISCDIYEHKLRLIEEQAKRSGITNIHTMLLDGTAYNEEFKEAFDRVLSDVPCSGLGVLRRKPEIKYKEAFDMKALEDVQKKILRNALSYLKVGGILVYSTCTVNPDENQGVTGEVLKDHPGYTVLNERHLSPLTGTDGFYMCKIKREA